MNNKNFNKLTSTSLVWPLLMFITSPWSSSVSSCSGEVPDEILLPFVFFISGHEYARRTLLSNENSGPFLGLLPVLCPKIIILFYTVNLNECYFSKVHKKVMKENKI